MDSCWHTLGLEAAHADIVAVKRAYALKLRVTRPDDDPDAYQRLREAYERAQAELRWRREQEAVPLPGPAAAAGPATPADPVPHPPTVVALQPREVAVYAPDRQPGHPNADGAPHWIDPGELARELVAHWKQRGDDALLDAWPALAHHLDQIPLALRGESNRWFAELVLQNQDLPPDFVARLAQHFAWGQDFRVEQMLGYERAERLRELLRQDHIVPIRDPAVLAQYQDLFTFDALLSSARTNLGRRIKAWCFATIAHPSLAQRGTATPPLMLNAMGLDMANVPRLRAALVRVFWLRIALATLLLSATPPATDADAPPWFLRFIGLAVGLGAALVVLLTASKLLSAVQTPPDRDSRRRRWFQRHRDTPLLMAGVAVGFILAWALATVAYLNVGEDWRATHPELLILWAALIAASTVVVWPSGRPWELLMLPVASLAAISLTQMLAGTGGAFAGVPAAGLWLVLCHAALVLRGEAIMSAYRRPWLLLRPRAWWGWLLLAVAIKAVAGLVVVALVLTLPLSLMVIAAVYGFGLPLTAIAAAVLFAVAGHLPSPQPPFMLPAAAGVAIGLMALQAIGTRLSRWRWFRGD